MTDRSAKVLALYRKAAGTDNAHERDAFLAKAGSSTGTSRSRTSRSTLFEPDWSIRPGGRKAEWWDDAVRRYREAGREGVAAWIDAERAARHKSYRDEQNAERQALGLTWTEYRDWRSAKATAEAAHRRSA